MGGGGQFHLRCLDKRIFQEETSYSMALQKMNDIISLQGSGAMRVLIVEPERRPEVREIDGSLKSMQEIVGGLIQPIPLIGDPDIVLVCNDEGKLLNLPANRGLRDENGQIYDIVCGTFFICGAPTDSDHLTSLTQDQIERYQKQFYTPEMFWGMDGHIICLPLEVD